MEHLEYRVAITFIILVAMYSHMKKTGRKKLLAKVTNLRGILFHIAGISCLIWFLIRTVPAPHRYQYPCQQISRTVALGYIAYWSVLFIGISLWLRQVKVKMASLVPAVLMVVMVGGMAFGSGFFDAETSAPHWTPVAKDPMGTPVGIHPGRVVWVWNPDATESEQSGYWWEAENNNQTVITQMFSSALRALTGEEDERASWDALFTHFNEMHGKGEIGYQQGERIAIKINMNNCWSYGNPYTREDNDRDASPYVVKALLRQLVNVAGVPQEDITIYDASRPIPNWFYNRVYYEEYPADSPVPEFPGVHFADSTGGAPGREKVVASTEKIYFTDGTVRTLPTCVTEAEYIINSPLLKMHPINNGVTLSGKNMFGTWMEPVEDIHPYHESGQIMGNPAPQVDLLCHEQIGGKTFLYLGDGTYGTLKDHKTIAKFQTYPFSDDWSNSLFLSQDPVALDSVMFDFLNSEADPIEGSQNYLHQAAEPPSDTYDPEHDGTYLSKSLGVHEHWDPSVDIFSPERYSGPDENGIDFVALGAEYASPEIRILSPKENTLYVGGREVASLPFTVILGHITVEATIEGTDETVEKIEFYVDNELKCTDYEVPYTWSWDEPAIFIHTIGVTGYYDSGETVHDEMEVMKFL